MFLQVADLHLLVLYALLLLLASLSDLLLASLEIGLPLAYLLREAVELVAVLLLHLLVLVRHGCCYCLQLVLLVLQILVQVHDPLSQFVLSATNTICFLLLGHQLLLQGVYLVVEQLDAICVLVSTGVLAFLLRRHLQKKL